MIQTKSVLKSVVVALVVMGVAQIAHSSDSEAVKNATKAAESWLAYVDAGDYTKSLEQSAELFRAAVTPEQWNQALSASRKPLGSLISREVKTTQYATSLPGAPDGEYVIIQFTTSLTNKNSATETVTPMKDPDGVWRVSGYYIK